MRKSRFFYKRRKAETEARTTEAAMVAEEEE